MKVLVIGGTLYIGRLLVEELVKAGHDIAILHRKAKHEFGRRVENLMADRNDPDSLKEVLTGRRFEVVYDNAYDWERGTTAAQVEATVHACGGNRLNRYIFLSSVAAYGDGLNHKESDPLAPDYHANPYIRFKASTERQLFRMHSKGLPVVTFRPPFVFGAGRLTPFSRMQAANLVSAALLAAPLNRRPPPGKLPPPHFFSASWSFVPEVPDGGWKPPPPVPIIHVPVPVQ